MTAGQFHIGPQGPGRCEASAGKCPYGGENGDANHFDSYEEAERGFSLIMSHAGLSGFRSNRKKAKEHPNEKVNEAIKAALAQDASLSVQALEQEQLLQKLSSRRETMSDEDFNSRADFVESVTARMKFLGLETDRVYKTEVGGEMVYSKERQELHEEILDHFEREFATVPAQRRAYMAGGLGGAGKGSILAKLKISSRYATINPDDVKEYMAEKGLIPKVQGLTPMEASTLVHEEASDISAILLARLMKQGKNVNLDTTLGGLASARRKIDTLQNSGYKVKGIFVDITVEASEDRAMSRYKWGLDSYLTAGGKGIGGRPVPKGVNHGASDPRHNSQNAENFIQLFKEGKFYDTPKVFNNMGAIPKTIEFKNFA